MIQLKKIKEEKNMVSTIIKSVTAAMVVSTLLTGCGSEPKPKPVKEEKADFRCRQDGVLAPQFTCDPYADGAIVGLGIAKPNAGNDKSFQRTEAMAAARNELAKQLEVKVSNLFKSYKGVTGSGKAATFDKATSEVSKQLASQTLRGSRQVGNSWRNPKTGELYIMVGISTAEVQKKMDSAIKTSFKNDKAMYQQFLAAKANGELEKELEKAKSE
jgi:hypothetical protein